MQSAIISSSVHTEVEALKSGSRVILLRHANTIFNLIYDKLLKDKTPEEEIRLAKIKKELRDAPLSQLGIEQCEQVQNIANSLNVEVVAISPLRRALETAYHIFKNHPNFENIKFIMLPNLREALDTSCDIPVNIFDTIEEFKSKLINFDYSEIHKYSDALHFFLEDSEDHHFINVMTNKVDSTEDSLVTNAFDLLTDLINSNYPNKIENSKSVIKRINTVRESITSILKTKMNEEDSKLIVISHSNYLKFWTGKWDRPVEDYDEVPKPKESKWFKNCEFYSDNINFPLLE